MKKDYDSTRIYRNTQKKGASQTYDTPSFFLRTFASEIKKKVNEECLQDCIKKSLIDKEIIYIEKQGVFLADCVFEL